MSMGTVYVKAVDGKYYAEPKFRGVSQKGNRWYLCFDEDDDPELVIETTHGVEAPEVVMPDFCSNPSKGTTGTRVFRSPDKALISAPAKAYWVRCHRRISVPEHYDQRITPSEKMLGINGTYYDFGWKKR